MLDCNLTKWVESNMPPLYNPNDLCSRSPYYTVEGKNLLAGFRDSIDPMMQAQMGICGDPAYLSGVSTSTAGKYYCMIQILEDTVFNITAGNTDELNGDGTSVDLSPLSLKVFKAGMIINGTFKKVVLASGFVKLYPHPFL